jgi:uncharacterized hydrophobic protein (TIGR00341 family)
MAFHWIDVLARDGLENRIATFAEQGGAAEVVIGDVDAKGRRQVRLLVGDIDRQKLLDQIQSAIQGTADWRIIVSATEAVIPHEDIEPSVEPETEEEDGKSSRAAVVSREELYDDMARGVGRSTYFFLLAALSTIVAGIGLVEDNIAVVIGAMVIAPLLGPNMAFAFAAAIGDRKLMLSSLGTNALGLGLTILLAAAIPLLLTVDPGTSELSAQTEVGFESVALAFASGAAAALSVTTGISTALVGVMVAVALLPPAAAFGIMLSLQHWDLAFGAAILLAVNVACVNLSANLVFIARGIHPRTWYERQSARGPMIVNLVFWTALLALLVGLIAYLRYFGPALPGG